MGALANPYILAGALIIGVGYMVVDEVKEPINTAIHKVEDAGKAVGRGFIHVVTLGQK